jgi:hypothetical protein
LSFDPINRLLAANNLECYFAKKENTKLLDSLKQRGRFFYPWFYFL